MQTLSKPLARRSDRGGFTMLELLIVIAILLVLIGLLVPAIGQVQRTVRRGQVKAEITTLEGAISNFKAVYGVEPPSRIALYENAAGWSGDPISTARIRRIWPNFDFTALRDINQNGTFGENVGITLTGAECLVFFLGGVPTRATATAPYVLNGFSKNPANPFATGGNREGPFHEFNPARLVNVVADGATVGYPEYLDTFPGQTNPYLYFSNFDSQGYLADIVVPQGSRWALADNKIVPASITPDAYLMPRCYILQMPTPAISDLALVGTGGVGTAPSARTVPSTVVFHKAQSFQIISPGQDGRYGTGGVVDTANGTQATPAPGLPTPYIVSPADFDNITNFTSSVLLP